jgi:hypothetical protein
MRRKHLKHQLIGWRTDLWESLPGGFKHGYAKVLNIGSGPQRVVRTLNSIRAAYNEEPVARYNSLFSGEWI